jgi:hypothetical protein
MIGRINKHSLFIGHSKKCINWLHIFILIRYFGFMAICNMKEKLARCFDLIDEAAFLPSLEGLTALEIWRNISGADPLLCPKCKTGMMKPVPIEVAGKLKPG